MEKPEITNLRYPHAIKILRVIPGKGSEDNPFADDDVPVEDTQKVLYYGEGRSYTDTTTEGNKNVDEVKRKSSVPVRFDEWDEGALPQDGDIIESVAGKNMSVGIVKDSEPDNDRTVIYWSLRMV